MARNKMDLLPEPGALDSLYVLDLSNFVWRFVTAPGQGPHAGVGFVRWVRRILRERRPARLAVARDNAAPTFRHALMAENRELLGGEYKEERRRRVDPVVRARALEQCWIAEEMLGDLYGLSCHTHLRFEADDVCATWAQRGLNVGLRVVVVANDKDMLQLVTTDSDRCVVWDGKYRVTDALAVEARLGPGVFPDRVAEYLAICGDSGDGYKGVVGAGEVAAQLVLRKFRSLEEALAATDLGDQHPFWAKQPKLWQKFAAQKAQARLCLRLATLARDVPLSATLADVEAETREAVRLVLADKAAEDGQEADHEKEDD